MVATPMLHFFATIKLIAERIGVGAAILLAAGLVAKIAFEIAMSILGAIYPAPTYFCRTDCTPLSRLWWLDRDIDVATSISIMTPILVLVLAIAIVAAVLFVRIYRSFGRKRT